MNLNQLTLRDYQIETLLSVQNMWQRGYYATLCHLFTGAGKTEIFVTYVNEFVNLREKRVLVLTPAHIIYQTKHRFVRRYPHLENRICVNGTEMVRSIGVVMGTYNEPDARIIIGSIPTLIDRVPSDFSPLKKEDILINDFGGVELSPTSSRDVLISARMDEVLKHGMIDEIIVDECHHSPADRQYALITRLWQLCDLLGLPPAKTIGFTATPFREDGIGLGNIFQTFAIQRTVRWGIKNGFLASLLPPIRVHAQVGTDREKIKDVLNWTDVVVRAWVEKAKARPTLAYLSSIKESRELALAFQAAGISAVHIDGDGCIGPEGEELPKESREQLFNKFMTGEIFVICNHAVLLEAIDLPPASCMIWGRNTDNAVLFTQALGRILRLFEGNEYLPSKEDALIIDIAASDMQMLNTGTLAGFKIDENGQYIEDPTSEEEDIRLIDGVDLRDVERKGVASNGILYSIGRIVQKSGSDWFQSDDDILSLPISAGNTLVITPPYYTLATHLNRISNTLLSQIEQSPDNEKLKLEYDKVIKASEIFGNYVLWHVQQGQPIQNWVRVDESLSLLMDFAIPYAYEASTPVKSFVSKNVSWKSKEHASEAQKRLLMKKLGDIDPDITKGDAMKLISHIIAVKEAVIPFMANIYKTIAEYAKIQ